MMNFVPVMLSAGSATLADSMHHVLAYLINVSIVAIEFLGLLVIVATGVKAFFEWIKKDEMTRLHLAEGLSTALSFLLCGEILRTVLIHEMSEVFLIGGIVVLRVALTLLIHWEASKEKEEIEEHHKH